MKLLWIELKKLLLAGLRLATLLWFALLVLNLGVGGTALLDQNPESSTANNITSATLLHMQLFGLVHIHEPLVSHRHPAMAISVDTPPGVTQEVEPEVVYTSTTWDMQYGNSSAPLPLYLSVNHTAKFESGETGGLLLPQVIDYEGVSIALPDLNKTPQRAPVPDPVLLPSDPFLDAPEKPPEA
ncbi:MAG TPA: hypothetical protein VH186_05130 [Chloroflexia bacterium]|nr:hypothetical protein [Chloroflexia bacterium]